MGSVKTERFYIKNAKKSVKLERVRFMNDHAMHHLGLEQLNEGIINLTEIDLL